MKLTCLYKYNSIVYNKNLIYFFLLYNAILIIILFTTNTAIMQNHNYMSANVNLSRDMYELLPQKVSNKKKRTPAHPLTIEFSSLILTEIYNHITKVISKENHRSILLIRFPILYGCIVPHFRCKRSELEHLIEYIRAYAIRSYALSVPRSFHKTKLFKSKVLHFSQVKMRNILYALSDNYYTNLGVIKILCGHTIIWRDSMYNTCKPSGCLKIEQQDITQLNINYEKKTINSPNNLEMIYELMGLHNFIDEDNKLRHSFRIRDDLDY